MPSRPLSWRSSTVVTALSTVSAEAPMYVDVTVTWGAARLGYCSMGRLGMAMAPTSVMRMEMTLAKMGRLMKKSENMVAHRPPSVPASRGVPASPSVPASPGPPVPASPAPPTPDPSP